jgi:uncharacterized short protein YbdD (DUF466 family)
MSAFAFPTPACLAAVAALLLAGCFEDVERARYGIPLSPSAERTYQQYLEQLRHGKPGSFAVSRDGRHAAYAYCKEMRCNLEETGYGMKAVELCNERVGPDACVLYAVRGRPVFDEPPPVPQPVVPQPVSPRVEGGGAPRVYCNDAAIRTPYEGFTRCLAGDAPIAREEYDRLKADLLAHPRLYCLSDGARAYVPAAGQSCAPRDRPITEWEFFDRRCRS